MTKAAQLHAAYGAINSQDASPQLGRATLNNSGKRESEQQSRYFTYSTEWKAPRQANVERVDSRAIKV
jgi:hypothetical protein